MKKVSKRGSAAGGRRPSAAKRRATAAPARGAARTTTARTRRSGGSTRKPRGLTAADVMTRKVITVNSWARLDDLADTLAADGISGAPVLGPEGRLLGIVSRTDLLEYLSDQAARRVRETRPPESAVADVLDDAEPARAWEAAAPTVSDIMNPEVVTVRPETPVSDIARLMARHRIHRVVVTRQATIEGIVTSLDLLECFPRGTPERRS